MTGAMLRPKDGVLNGPAHSLGGGAKVTARHEGLAIADARDLACVAKADQAAFRALVARHVAAVHAVGRRILADEAEAEDVAQETFLRLWRKAGSIEVGPAGVRPWLNRVAQNLCLDRIRARRTEAEPTDDPPEIATAPEQLRGLETAELEQKVRYALEQLPERQRLALVLFHYQGMSQNEAASTLEISAEALESLLARARRTLKAALVDEWREMLPDSED
jgi:RNA polymerase sigma-70 factor (ECF subfamily)